ncbi:protoporphyrinogen oxidase [Cryobacterium sp. TMT2-10]|uniref:Coproporphyrinogen III oxidase n=1 Tax=Cryobacterium shii TaxID=1259235 RepID=A0AAQ2C6V8_9MICO|nr:protoporphyrinogen oxidase [Cryobacterium shii]TFC82962.1 protoporphyrinogen oxidase [Cryobacterium sp. TmT2-59]TFD17248.1 protoporphyrinogen oxidase [Cryobacterium sp. TMT4-10]TFD25733.1 protoporphyrinogen oxidase [Cryobacterium sp. TMT2-23]TFD42697.1 protoporphyrinogen oxidase [Cryobacterium sp. TMT2-10]
MPRLERGRTTVVGSRQQGLPSVAGCAGRTGSWRNIQVLSQPRIVIVGGGISGLATAHYLHRRLGADVQLSLVEAGPRLGGKIATEQFGGHLVDVGPDALMVRAPVAAALIEDLGLSDLVVAPAGSGARIWSRGALRRLPAGTLFGIPDRLLPLMKSRLLSPLGLARAALDVVLPTRAALPEDPTIAELVRPRMGGQVFDRLVDPLLGGVHAGRADELSARSTAPDIEALGRANRSLYLGLRRRRRNAPKPAGTGGAALVTLVGGLARLIDALADRVAGDDVRLGSAAVSVTRDENGTGYLVALEDGTVFPADAVVLAIPAFVAAGMIAAEAPDLAAALGGIPYVDVATICLAYPHSAVAHDLDGTGFLVPPEEGRLIVGCTWSSVKWPHLADENTVLIRCMVGRRRDQRWVGFDDDTLVSQVHAELVEAMGLTGRPTEQHIERWPQGMPQYVVGHQARLAAAEEALGRLPGIRLTGSAYRGVGLASCVADAERTADSIAQVLSDARARSEASA